jgi:hypothetical protein
MSYPALAYNSKKDKKRNCYEGFSMHIFIEIISKFGVSGLLFTMALEGLSVPIPGIIVVLTLGYILNLSLAQTLIVAVFMSALYS